jgi:hypothetical protein
MVFLPPPHDMHGEIGCSFQSFAMARCFTFPFQDFFGFLVFCALGVFFFPVGGEEM